MNSLSLLPLPIASLYCDVLVSDSDVVILVFSVVINCLSALMKHFLASSQRNHWKSIKLRDMPWTHSSLLLYLCNDTEGNKICTSLVSSHRLKTLVRWLRNSVLQDGSCVVLSVTREQILLKFSKGSVTESDTPDEKLLNGFKSSFCLPNATPQGPGFHGIVLCRTSTGSICNLAHTPFVYPLH